MTRWVVVGAGAAGCVVASRLADVATNEVALVEAGAAAPPVGDDWFAALAEPGRTFPGPFRRGRGIGGSTAINGMLATAAPADWYAEAGIDAAAVAAVRVPQELALDELGPIDRALLEAAPDAAPVLLARSDGRRVTAAEAYRSSAVDVRAGLEVARVVVDRGRVVGVESTTGELVAADRVVLAAGAIGSPLLLFASGVTAPGVGEGLQNHVGVPIALHLHRGVTADGLVTGTHLRRDDLEVVPLNHLGSASPGQAMLLVVAMRPTGRGRVVAGADGVAVIEQELSDHDRDRADAGVALAQELLGHPAFGSLVADVEIGAAPAGVFHPTSTCAMGAVVDGDGAVIGVENLYVADASVFASIPPTHTMLPTLALAEHLAARLVT